MPTIRFEDASVSYPGGVHALKTLTLEIPDGQMLVIVGLSGAGKSTLIRAINGLVPLTRGDVEGVVWLVARTTVRPPAEPANRPLTDEPAQPAPRPARS